MENASKSTRGGPRAGAGRRPRFPDAVNNPAAIARRIDRLRVKLLDSLGELSVIEADLRAASTARATHGCDSSPPKGGLLD